MNKFYQKIIFLFSVFLILNLGNYAQVSGDDEGDDYVDDGGDDDRAPAEDSADDEAVSTENNSSDVEGEDKHLVYLTLSPKSEEININLVTSQATSGQYKVSVEEGKTKTSQKTKFEYNLSNDKDALAHDADDLGAYTVAVDAPGDDATLEYKVNGLESSNVKVQKFGSNKDDTNLNVCVFGDYRADLYTQIDMSLSKLIEENKCNLNLFTGKITWEQRPNGFSFNPFLMLHDNNQDKRHIAFSKVPSIFGEVGHDLKETTFFQSVEVNNVAFIQTTVTLVTIANITYGTEQFDKVEEYFRETMLNELECKLQELHRRTDKPWIVVYLTHPSLFKDRQVNWLMLNSVDRFFEILKRYKIDLLTSCGIEGMSQILKDRAVSHPEEQLPAYVQTTLAECGGYQAFAPGLQNECSYAVLNIRKDKLSYVKKNPLPKDNESADLDKGSIDKNTQEPDKCVEMEL